MGVEADGLIPGSHVLTTKAVVHDVQGMIAYARLLRRPCAMHVSCCSPPCWHGCETKPAKSVRPLIEHTRDKQSENWKKANKQTNRKSNIQREKTCAWHESTSSHSGLYCCTTPPNHSLLVFLCSNHFFCLPPNHVTASASDARVTQSVPS